MDLSERPLLGDTSSAVPANKSSIPLSNNGAPPSQLNPPQLNIPQNQHQHQLTMPPRNINHSQSHVHSQSQSHSHSQARQKRSWMEFFKKLSTFLGPGFLVSVGYLDPGNWATSLAAGSKFGYRLLFVVLLSNGMAMLLQSLCVRLGIITGRDLAQSCRKFLPRWLSLILYVLCEIAIMATDLAEVIGSAMALNLLFGIPMVWGVLITGLDVLIIIGVGFNAKHMRYFEFLIALLVLVTAVCLFIVAGASKPALLDVLYGFLPNSKIVTDPGSLYVAVGIIGATVMPHNLYLHSSIVKYRSHSEDGALEEIGEKLEEVEEEAIEEEDEQDEGQEGGLSFKDPPLKKNTQPLNRMYTLPTILEMSNLDSFFALLFALFVNASILIIASANFYVIGKTDVAEIPDAFRLIGSFLGQSFAMLFAVALLLAGQSSTITGTMAGQIVMQGFLGSSFVLEPWIRRLVTRSLAIGPALLSILIFGSGSLNNLLILSQIVLSLQLPFAVWPLIYFTSKKEIMTIYFKSEEGVGGDLTPYRAEPNPDAIRLIVPEDPSDPEIIVETRDYSNGRWTLISACVVCSMLTIFNFILLFEVARGNS